MQFGFDCNFMKGEGGGEEIDRGDPLESYSTGELFIRGWKRSLKVSLSYYESHECEQGFLYRIFLYGQYNAILEFGVENRFELYFKGILYILFPEG